MHPSGWRKREGHSSILVALDGHGEKHGSLLEEFVDIPEEIGGGGRSNFGGAGGIVHVWELKNTDGSNFTGSVGGLVIAGNANARYVWTTDDQPLVDDLTGEPWRNNLLVAFPLAKMLSDLAAGSGVAELTMEKEYHVDCKPSSLWFDNTPGKEMMWVSEVS